MRRLNMTAGSALLLSLVLLVAGAAPASASPLLAAAKPWHYWAAPLLAVSVIGIMLMLVLGYVLKVVTLKYGIRVGKR